MITLSTRFKVQPLYTWSLSQQDCHPKSWSDVLRYKNHAIELNYEDTSRGIYYIVSWFALEIKLSEGWFERVRAEGHCWTSIKMSPHTECQNYANIPQSSSLRQTFTHRCNFQQVYWGKGRPAIYACSWLSDCTLHNHCILYFIFCILTFAFYILAIYACSGSGSLSCYHMQNSCIYHKGDFLFCKPQFYSQLLIFNTTLVCSELHSSDVLRSYQQP